MRTAVSRWGKAAALAATALAAAALAGEAAVRVAALFLPDVKYLSSTRVKSRARRHETLESFLAAQAEHLVPHRAWRNHHANALGFNDEEFAVPKPPGRYRIVALGDSFCFSMAPYPDAVQTLVERRLRGACGRDLDLLNAGIGGATPWEYRTLFDLMQPSWRPDAVVLHFYLGNDGPDLFRHTNQLPVRREPALHSAFLTYARNAVRLLRSREAPLAEAGARQRRTGGGPARGGGIVDPALAPLTDASPEMAGPVFSAEAFERFMGEELGRLYLPPEGAERDWEPILALLDGIRHSAAGDGVDFLMVLYPSRLQVEPATRARLIESLQRRREYRRFDPSRVDPMAPNRFLLDWCTRSGVACHDLTPSLVAAARREPAPLYIARDSHWNLLGNRLAAEDEAAFLSGELCRRPPP